MVFLDNGWLHQIQRRRYSKLGIRKKTLMVSHPFQQVLLTTQPFSLMNPHKVSWYAFFHISYFFSVSQPFFSVLTTDTKTPEHALMLMNALLPDRVLFPERANREISVNGNSLIMFDHDIVFPHLFIAPVPSPQ